MLSLCIVSTYAQQETGTFTIQPKLGFNIANITDGYNMQGVQKKPIYGFAAGLEAEYLFSERLGISFGALYSMQGAKARTSIDGIGVIETFKGAYINIPLMAKIYFVKEFAFNLGIQPAFKISDSYKVSALGLNFGGDMSDLGFDVRTFYFSIPLGFSIEISQIVLDARYLIGISDIIRDSDEKHSVFQFTLGYKFKTK